MKRALLLLIIVIVAACKPETAVREEVEIEFAEDGHITITADMEFGLKVDDPKARQRMESMRQLALSDIDPWAVRFSRVTPERERLTFDRDHGELERVTRSGSFRDKDVLQHFFSDTPLTIQFVDRDSEHELSVYPSSSPRATREQKEHFERAMRRWTNAVAHYFNAVHDLYSYLDTNPGREPYVFQALLDERDVSGLEVPVLEEEAPLVSAVIDAMALIGEGLEHEDGYTLHEEADLVLNPFPARLRIRLPSDATSVEGFTLDGKRTAIAEPVDLLATITSLEGEWISPDPLAQFMREERISARQLAAMPRKSTPVVRASHITAMLMEKMKRPPRYVVRW